MNENKEHDPNESLKGIAASTSRLLSELDDSKAKKIVSHTDSGTGATVVRFGLPQTPKDRKYKSVYHSIGAIALLTASACLAVFIFSRAKESRQFALADSLVAKARAILAKGLPLADDNKTHMNAFLEAFEAASKSIEAKPINSEAYALRARARTGLGQYPEAVADADKAISLDPASWDAFFARANAKSQLGDKKGQMEDLNKAISINPGFAGAYVNRASLKISTGDHEGAVSDLSSALGLNSVQAFQPARVADIMIDRANLYFRLNRMTESCSDYKTAIDLYQKSDEAKYQQRVAWLNSDGGAWCRTMK